MNNHDQWAAFGGRLGPKHIDDKGNLHFKARIIYKWTDKMQQDVADVTITRNGAEAANITISNAHSLQEDKFILSFSSIGQAFKFEADNSVLIVTGSDEKLQGDYSVEIIPEW